MAEAGHNSEEAAKQLKSFIERVERLEEEKAALSADIKEVLAEAKIEGFETKIIREVIKRRKMDPADRQQHDEILELYEGRLGDMLS